MSLTYDNLSIGHTNSLYSDILFHLCVGKFFFLILGDFMFLPTET